jgi:hypothetical protein
MASTLRRQRSRRSLHLVSLHLVGFIVCAAAAAAAAGQPVGALPPGRSLHLFPDLSWWFVLWGTGRAGVCGGLWSSAHEAPPPSRRTAAAA